MKVLVVGGGGREHALVRKIKESFRVKKIYCLPGNGGIARDAECANISVDEIEKIVCFVCDHGIDLTVVGPEAPLVAGLVDALQAAGKRAFGPVKEAARLEGSKAFAKEIMWEAGIPTARGRICKTAEEAFAYIEKVGAPIVVKADGLAAGKGVVVAEDLATAREAVHQMMEKRCFGAAGEVLVLEEVLRGPEVSLLFFVDGKTALPMEPAQDYKRVFDGDKGPNTGGMGAFCPSPTLDAELIEKVRCEVVMPALTALRKRGVFYCGVLYVGLILTSEGPKVLEFNARFGDPETQVILPRLKNDLVEVMEAVIDGKLNEITLEWDLRKTLCVVLSSEGYPGSYRTGDVIEGLQEESDDLWIIHAGTKLQDGQIVTSGGRVLAVVGRGEDFSSLRQKIYERIRRIHFSGMHYRTDIGK